MFPMPPPNQMIPPGVAPLPPVDPMLGAPPMAPPMEPTLMPPPALPAGMPDIAGEGAANPLIAFFEGMTKRVGPRRPRNWVEPPKPTKSQIMDFSSSQERLFTALRDRFDDDEQWFNGDKVGVFRSFDADEDETLPSSAMTDDVNLVANIGAGIDITFQVLYTDPSRVEDTQKCEDFLYRARSEAERRHTRAGGGDLPRDEWLDAALRGRVVCRILPDFDDELWPFRETLLEPGNVYPEWDNGDIRRLVHVYTDTVSGIVTAFDDADGTVRKRLVDGEDDRDRRNGKKRRMSDSVRVIEYWDTEYKALLVDGIAIIEPTEHEYGFVPFVYQIAPLGMPAHSRRARDSNGLAATSDEEGDRLAKSGVSLFHYRKRIHEKQEAMMGLLLNVFEKNANNPAWIITGDETAQKMAGARTIINKRDVVNYVVKEREQLQPLVENVNAGLATPIIQDFERSRSTGAFPLSSHGASQDGQISGNAIEGLNESGRDKLSPYLRMFESYHERKGWMYLTFWRDWGNLAMPDPITGNPTGAITVPFRDKSPVTGRRVPAFELDVETVERAGTNVECRATSVRLQNLGALGNAASIWMQGGMMSKREAMELRGVRDPDAVFDQIAYENATQTEEYMTASMVIEIIKRQTGMDDDDPAFMDLKARVMMTVYGAKLEAMMNPAPSGGGGQDAPMPGQMGGAPMPAMGPGGPPMGAPGMAPPGPDIQTSGMNLAAMGMGPGSQGGPVGRPMGT